MNFVIMLFLCILAWSLTLSRIRTIQWRDIRKDHGITLNVWLMMVFFSITMIFLIKRVCNLLNDHTINNLDRLISYSSILIGMFFGAAASAAAVGKPRDRKIIRWLRYSLVLTILALVLVYTIYISRIPNMEYYVPRSLPEVAFMWITFIMGIALCAFVIKVYRAHLPQEKSPVMRMRTILIIVSTFLASVYFLVKIASVGGYFSPFLASSMLIDLSTVLLISSALTHFSALLSNKIYLPLVTISRNIEGWSAFKDLKYLMERVHQLCPEVALPATNPSFLSFLLNPEYHLYRAIISVMDGKTMLDDLLLEGALHEEPKLWEGDLLREAIRFKQALQSINPSKDFWMMVSEYQEASRRLHKDQRLNLSVEVNLL